jgi:PAS domain S-box-containing protein
VHLEVTISGQFDSAGVLEGVIVIGVDRSARQKAESALYESEKRYTELVNSLKVGVFLNTPEPDGHFLEFNPAMVDIFEADSAEQLMRFPASQLYRIPSKRGEFSEKLLRQGFLENEEIELVTLKGRYFTASVTATVKKQEDGTALFYGILQDVTDQKRLETSLREERDRLRRIASHIGAGLILLDSQLEIVWANEVIEGWFGRLDSIKGRECFDILHHHAATCEECPTILAFRTKTMQSMEKRVVFPNGKMMDFVIISSPIKNERGEVEQVLELVMDFTERRRMIELLEYERALSRNVIDSIADPLVVFDAQNKCVLDVNKAFLEFRDIRKRDIIGQSCDTVELTYGETCPLDELEEILRTGIRKEISRIFRNAAGQKVYLDVFLSPLKDEKGQVVGLIHIARDVSDRKILEDELKRYSEGLEVLVKERTQALQTSELMFRRLFESAQDGILILDPESGIIIDANSTLLQLLGYERDALKDKDYRQAPCFKESREFIRTIEELKQKIVVFLEDAALKSASGKEVSVELRASLYHVENRKVVQCNIRDITERKKLDKIKTEFVSMVSHELRTPLSAIKEGVEIVADGTQGKLNHDQAECLNIALSNIRRLNRLIGDILDISKIQSNLLKMEIVPCGIPDIVDQVYNFVRIEMEKRGLVLVTNLERDLPDCLADRDRLTQVLMNLLNNAVKFTRDNSRVNLMCRRVAEGVEFTVADQGPGISQDEISRLFGRFVQLDSTLVRRVGGTGLGLYISKNLVEAMGGSIWAESVVGVGTEFKFILPVQNKGG